MRSLLVFGGLWLSINAATISRNGRCGPAFGETCLNSQFGSCCSQYGWCGSTPDHCGTGCQSGFGTCTSRPSSSSSFSTSTRTSSTSTRSSTVSSNSPTPSASQPVSQNSRCGAGFGGQTCLGSPWGNCCSQYNYCGSTADYCAPQSCQPKYGQCDTASSSRTQSSATTSQTTTSSTSRTSSSSSSSTTSTRTSSSTSQTSTQTSSRSSSSSSSTSSSSSSSSSSSTSRTTSTSSTSSSTSSSSSSSTSISSTSTSSSSSSSTATPISSSTSPASSSSSSADTATSSPTSTSTSTTVTSSTVSTTSTTATTSSALPQPTACNPGGLQPRFLLLVSNPNNDYDGQYGIQDDNISAEDMTFGPVTSASVFTFNNDCSLVASSGNIANLPPGLDDAPLYFDSPNAIADNGFVPASCNIVNNALRCSVGTANTFYICNGDDFLQIAVRSPSTCAVPILRPVYVQSV